MSDIYRGVVVPLPPPMSGKEDFNPEALLNYIRQISVFHQDILYRMDQAGIGYTDRGEGSAMDKAVGDFTTDNTWRDWDISAIVPKNAKAAFINIEIKDDAAGSKMDFRRNGNTDATYSISSIATQVANVSVYGSLIVPVHSDRIIEYRGSNLAFITINAFVKGWFF